MYPFLTFYDIIFLMKLQHCSLFYKKWIFILESIEAAEVQQKLQRSAEEDFLKGVPECQAKQTIL